MARYRNALPQLNGGTFLSDGGMETTLIFHDGLELPHFASFVLLASEAGRQSLKGYYEKYLAIARGSCTGFVLDTATWRASLDWGAKLGYDADALKSSQPCFDRAARGASCRVAKHRDALRHQRRDRAARRWLQGRQTWMPAKRKPITTPQIATFRRQATPTWCQRIRSPTSTRRLA